MNEFINNLGYNNFIIIMCIIIAILVLLIVVFLIERTSSKKKYKEAITAFEETPKENIIVKEDTSNKNEYLNEKEKYLKVKEELLAKKEAIQNSTKENEITENNNKDINITVAPEVKTQEIKQEEVIPYKEAIIKATTIENPVSIQKRKEEVTYDEHKQTKEEAKEKLDEVTRKLVYEDQKKELEGPTFFEREQEEMSIISYDELKNINYDVDETNDRLLEDEGNEPITIEELYKKHVEKQDEENLENTKKIDNPIFDETITDIKKFKNSDVISPVFGVWKNELKQNKEYTKEDFDKTIELDELEAEIRRTEEFLKELKSLKNKLD